MNTARKLAYPSLILALHLAIFPPALHAEAPGHGWEKPAALLQPGEAEVPGLPAPFSRLALTETQQDQIFSILHGQVPTLRNNLKQQRLLREELASLLPTGLPAANQNDKSFDAGKARQLSERIGRLQGEALLARVSSEAQIRALLNPEQLAKLAATERFQSGHAPVPPGLRPPRPEGHGGDAGPNAQPPFPPQP